MRVNAYSSTSGAFTSGVSFSISSSAQLPSVSANGDNTFLLLYKSGNAIKYIKCALQPSGPYIYYPDGNNPTEISDSGTDIYTSPSIASYYYDDNFYAVWENQSVHTICFKQSTNGGTNWGYFHEVSYGSHSLSKPSIGLEDDSKMFVRVLFQCDTHIGEVMRDMSTSSPWTPVIELETAIGVNLPLITDAYTPTTAAWVSGTSAPYSVDLADISSDYHIIPATTINNNTDWDGVYYITGDITVNSGKTLSIEPGTVLMFSSGKSLIAYWMQSAHRKNESRLHQQMGLHPAVGDILLSMNLVHPGRQFNIPIYSMEAKLI